LSGTGFIGSYLAAVLLKRGYPVRILQRRSSNLVNFKKLPVEHSVGDVHDVNSPREAMYGCDTVFHPAAKVPFWRPLCQLQYEVNSFQEALE
jgi:nucleoside-diphosphate-sugar epimerase